MQKTWAKGYCLIGLGIQEIGEICLGNGRIHLTKLKPHLNFPRTIVLKSWSFTLDLSLRLKSSLTFLVSLSSSEPDCNSSVAFFESSTSDGDFSFSSKWTNVGLNVKNSVWRSSNGSNRKNPHIIEPVVGPSSENIKSLVVLRIKTTRRLSCFWFDFVFE